ncbi:hypothetical protein NDU88_006697 [Pleurodeles waltl]|uniref:Uncharacterized protein n=1 Tax=Pleurodeles waltl TaxID=8319 RepID=A0AAV7TYC2_PLEWA|nr:hypothetical protein NDU88_006697 [Pleurodeles waltl]
MEAKALGQAITLQEVRTARGILSSSFEDLKSVLTQYAVVNPKSASGTTNSPLPPSQTTHSSPFTSLRAACQESPKLHKQEPTGEHPTPEINQTADPIEAASQAPSPQGNQHPCLAAKSDDYLLNTRDIPAKRNSPPEPLNKIQWKGRKHRTKGLGRKMIYFFF